MHIFPIVMLSFTQNCFFFVVFFSCLVLNILGVDFSLFSYNGSRLSLSCSAQGGITQYSRAIIIFQKSLADYLR